MSVTMLKGAHLSFQQERLWSFQQEGSVYHAWYTLKMNGVLHVPVFRQVLQLLVEQYTIFQTVFYPLPGMDVPFQVIGQQAALDCPVISLEHLAPAERDTVLATLLETWRRRVLNLAQGPLICPVLFRLSQEHTLFFLKMPALYADASTLSLLTGEIASRYTALLSGQEIVEEPLQYTAFSAWLRQMVTEDSEEAEVAREFWKKIHWDQNKQILHQLEQVGILKGDTAQQASSQAFEPHTLPIAIDDVLSAQLQALISLYDVSMRALLLACWFIVLWRLTGESQLVIGVSCDERNDEELATALGLYARTVPLEATFQHKVSFAQMLLFVTHALKASEEQQAYFSWPGTDTRADQSFFPVAFEYEQWPTSFEAMGLQIQLDQRACWTEPFFIKLGGLQVGTHLCLELHYNAQNVASEWVKRIAAMLQELLCGVVAQPQAAIGMLPLLNEQERTHLQQIFSGSRHSWPEQSLQGLFEELVQRQPDALAVISHQERMTYQQLNAQANRLARVLRQHGIGPNALVGLCLPRQASSLVGLLGILKAGGAYLPLDANNPQSRLHFQLQESKVALLLTSEELRDTLPTWEKPTLYLEDLAKEMAHVSSLDQETKGSAQDLAYVIYTSGSTGTPKGVMISQRNAVNYTRGICERLDVQPGWHYATVSTLAADLGNTAIFAALASGGCVQVLDYEQVTSAQAMAEWAREHPIDVLKIVPSHLSALLESEYGHDLLPRQALVLGGEVLPVRLLQRIAKLGGVCAVYNHYGPTETTVGALVNPLGVQQRVEESVTEEPVALGYPLANTYAYVLDEHMQMVPQGVRGELYIGGAGVAWGYMGQGHLTAEHFVPDPYSGQEGTRLYRTGDLVRYGLQGQLTFLGRIDRQVKLRGHRIEVAEIEAVLRQHSQVQDCAVVLREDMSAGCYLAGYIVPEGISLHADINLRGFLQERLPEYMWPSAFLFLKFLPLNANGKVDRQRLIADRTEGGKSTLPLIETGTATRTITLPRDSVETQLVQIWEEVLQVQPVSIFDNFFHIGGHSLLAVRLMSHIAERFGQHLDLAMLFQHPTLLDLAVVLRQRSSNKEETPLVALRAQGSSIPFFCVHPSGGTSFCYVHLAYHLGSDQPFYGLQAPHIDSTERPLRTVEEMAAYYISAIQTVRPHGPYLLGGWSLGGLIALEMAQQLQRHGQEIALLAIIDSTFPDPHLRERVLARSIDLSDEGIVKELITGLKIAVPNDFDQQAVANQLSYVVAQAKDMQAIPSDTNIDLVKSYTRMKIYNEYIARLYTPSDFTGSISYFSSSLPRQSIVPDKEEGVIEMAVSQDRLQPWRVLAKSGLDVHYIPASHDDMIEEPHVQMLANALKTALRKGG